MKGIRKGIGGKIGYPVSMRHIFKSDSVYADVSLQDFQLSAATIQVECGMKAKERSGFLQGTVQVALPEKEKAYLLQNQ